jgi:hypothetical protein
MRKVKKILVTFVTFVTSLYLQALIGVFRCIKNVTGYIFSVTRLQKYTAIVFHKTHTYQGINTKSYRSYRSYKFKINKWGAA